MVTIAIAINADSGVAPIIIRRIRAAEIPQIIQAVTKIHQGTRPLAKPRAACPLNCTRLIGV